MKASILLTIMLACALGACSSEKSSSPAPAVAQPAPQPAEKTVFDTQLKALDKAKGVQDIVDKQKQATDKQLEDSGG